MTSRRDFLKKAGLLSAAFAVPALNVNGDTLQSKIRLKNTKIADLVDVPLQFLQLGTVLRLY